MSKKIMERNSKGAEIAEIQSLLKSLGYYQGNITGEFDLATEHAVKMWQADAGLSIDGKLSEKEIDILREAVEEAIMHTPGLKLFGSTIPWWAVALGAGAGIAGIIELISHLWRKR